jgi:dTDP-glucose pyrophosphorylase
VTAALDRLCVPADASIRRTMEVIDRGSAEIALVVDSGDRMIGTVSDGDIRRALLAGATLADAVGAYANHNYAWVGEDVDRPTVLDLMRARAISQVPVLDNRRRLVGLHLMRELIGMQQRDNIAVVLAGGRGTRLRPYTDVIPKPMVPVAGRPILERIVLHLVGAGIQTIYLAVSHMHELIENHFGDGSEFGCTMYYVRDLDMPLGTGGPLALLPDEARAGDTPLLVMNGDLVTQFDVGRLLNSHEAARAVVTVGVRNYAHEVPYGVLSLDGELVTSIEEKPVAVWLVNAGIYVVSPHALRRITVHRPLPMTDLVGDCLGRNERVCAHLVDGDWLDVGSPAELSRARGVS